MGLLKSIVSAMGQRNPELGAQASLLPVLLEQLERYPGGVARLIQQFQDAGLGGVVASWIREGRNDAISPAQVESVLGSAMVQELARRSGLETDAVLQNLSIMLPSLVDQATPGGEAALQRNLGGSAANALSGLFAGRPGRGG
jgi:uncharacterized protein YidB (DUF937 family)